MAKLRVPSVQHLARNWRANPAAIARALMTLALHPPRFNYDPLYLAVRDMLVLGVPYEQVVEGIRRKKREDVRENLLGVLPLIRDHFAGVSPSFYQVIDRRYYPVGRGLMVPFEPPMIYGVGGQLHFPWFSFWRGNPLAKERLALFVTLVDEILMQDPDLEAARFEILDFSCPVGEDERSLEVIDASEIPRVSETRKKEMLATFADGFFLALEGLAESRQSTEGADNSPDSDSNQLEMF